MSLASALSAGCQPNLGSAPSVIDGPRILAVQANPAEAAPGTMVSYTALTVYGNNAGTGEPGPSVMLPIDWAFCTKEKPLSDLADISEYCFTYLDDASASFLTELTPSPSGGSATGFIPTQACMLFGPALPPAMNGMPPGRPTDPDPTGGYYQPVRLILQSSGAPLLVAEESRLLGCGLPGATNVVYTQFQMEYHANTNPALTGIEVVSGGVTTPLSPDSDTGTGPGFPVKAGSKITLRASWPACPAAPTMAPASGCGAETYAYYDPLAQTVFDAARGADGLVVRHVGRLRLRPDRTRRERPRDVHRQRLDCAEHGADEQRRRAGVGRAARRPRRGRLAAVPDHRDVTSAVRGAFTHPS